MQSFCAQTLPLVLDASEFIVDAEFEVVPLNTDPKAGHLLS